MRSRAVSLPASCCFRDARLAAAFERRAFISSSLWEGELATTAWGLLEGRGGVVAMVPMR